MSLGKWASGSKRQRFTKCDASIAFGGPGAFITVDKHSGGGFLAVGVAFFAGGMTISLGSWATMLDRISFEQSFATPGLKALEPVRGPWRKQPDRAEVAAPISRRCGVD